MAIDKNTALQGLTQRHLVSFAGDKKSAELALNSLMDELDENDDGLNTDQAMEIAVRKTREARDKTFGR